MNNENKTSIGALRPGEWGFTVPWAMAVDANRQYWLHERYPVLFRTQYRGGTASVVVGRTLTGVYRAYAVVARDRAYINSVASASSPYTIPVTLHDMPTQTPAWAEERAVFELAN